MKILTKVKDMQQTARKLKADNQSIGFVATMGFLHEGHLELVKSAKENDDIVVMSIFVNPTQFGVHEDYDRYPRNFERDRQLAEENGVDILFFPSVEEMYPEELTTEIRVKKRVNVLCGTSRPGHFDGVATVLFKLFHIVLPDRAYFGLKDAQQVAVIDGFVHDYHFPVTIVACPTVREEDGLAKSSRNVNLTPHERKEAPLLYQHLLDAKQMIEEGERNPEHVRKIICASLTRSISGKIDYVQILSYPQLLPLSTITGKIIVALAVQYSNARLIDNIIWTVGEGSKCTEQ